MKIEIMETKKNTAEKGKIFRRKSDSQLFGSEIYLGYTYYIGGKKLETPLLEHPEDFIEIDIPEEYM